MKDELGGKIMIKFVVLRSKKLVVIYYLIEDVVKMKKTKP